MRIQRSGDTGYLYSSGPSVVRCCRRVLLDRQICLHDPPSRIQGSREGKVVKGMVGFPDKALSVEEAKSLVNVQIMWCQGESSLTSFYVSPPYKVLQIGIEAFSF